MSRSALVPLAFSALLAAPSATAREAHGVRMP